MKNTRQFYTTNKRGRVSARKTLIEKIIGQISVSVNVINDQSVG